jgi:hypothetical protein
MGTEEDRGERWTFERNEEKWGEQSEQMNGEFTLEGNIKVVTFAKQLARQHGRRYWSTRQWWYSDLYTIL